MVAMEALGLASAEIFSYNRENFQFDNDQRIHRDVQRVNMQIERFNLFREDIEDLVNLTVAKMDMYHLVSAVVLGFTTSIFTEGRVTGDAPPCYIAVYFMTIACGWLYLLLTAWLSMYASVASHSLGVRLRTRYVRLPIPNLQDITGIRSSLAHFEKQDASKVMRLPFQATPYWEQQSQGAGATTDAPSSSSTDVVARNPARARTAEDLAAGGAKQPP